MDSRHIKHFNTPFQVQTTLRQHKCSENLNQANDQEQN